MKELNYAALFIPLFFLFVWLERLCISHAMKKKNAVLESSVSNISIGVAERLINLFTGILFYNLFHYIYHHFAIYSIPSSWWVWVLLLLTADLVWYWYHRLGHRINLFWAAHIVHHQSENFNFTAAARITTFQAFIRYGFWAALPLIGFHPDMVISILLVHGIYSFFTHTEAIPSPKWMEYVFITPSLHGVHHASNKKYLDKNFGDVFVFWDKIFGTFQQEEEKPVYGLTHPLNSYSFLWQHFHYFMEIGEAFRRGKNTREKWDALFGGPEKMDQDIRPYLETRFMQHKVRSTQALHESLRIYLILQILSCVVLLTLTTFYFDFLGITSKVFILFLTLLTLINCGALMEQRKWIFYLEIARLHAFLLFLFHINDQLDIYPVMAISMILAQYILQVKKRYYRWLYSGRTSLRNFFNP
ncbi:Sterol desaturase/sphingolipid hydroxylase, fatty acid hydroxylase superfamily [Sinomicrobium oceani]|uniref:Sterol desaturase/sphingolipid hydroxylase, fatty acid hydroxylase superfamily n=1 Tax=Sinomicrobium oceani TaxID=1150368 RepID=A0A1K1QH86_9FLAO|nr:sterol desaturase family protein [Sinomicrobium oceani]SFW59049.1 Sterol desaturase/sphingolipid hydroxylase, fatty acid hydroxylase superfamily [Sinomicrobium oceani]